MTELYHEPNSMPLTLADVLAGVLSDDNLTRSRRKQIRSHLRTFANQFLHILTTVDSFTMHDIPLSQTELNYLDHSCSI